MASVLSQCVDCGKTHPPRAALNRSPFDSLLSRQNFPNASESAAIRDFLQDTDAEIASRERTIDRLLCEVAELRRRSDYHKAVIAPIRRVPPEVMAEIFLHLTAIEAKAGSDWRQCAQEERLFRQEYMVRPIVHKAPLVFCEISRKWRCIAISTPSLWYSLSLRCGNKKTPTGNSLCEMWLQRSGSLPLSIRLYPQPSRFWERRKIIDDSEDIMKTILSVAKRWRFLDLDGLPASSYNVLRGHLPDSVPMLETLFVRHRQRPPFAEIARLTPWAGLCGAPKLLRLYIDTICEANIMGQGEQSTFSWSRLTHINAGDCSVDDCLQFLAGASMAVACRFRVTRPSSAHHPPILHHALQTLEVQVDGSTSLDPWWSCLTCAELSTLSIDSDMISQGLPSFIARTGGTIEDLTLMRSSLDDNQFMACLANMPFLRHLTVFETGASTQFTAQVWESLTWAAAKDSPPPLTPNLESLYLQGAIHSSHKSIARVLKSRLRVADRQEMPLALKTVTVEFWRNISESAFNKLMAFREWGLQMNVDSLGEEDDGSEAEDDSDNDG